jgi:hypothetical protein
VDRRSTTHFRRSDVRAAELRVKIKSLAAEARIIAREERRVLSRIRRGGDPAAGWLTFRHLHDHRRRVVGTAAREALLAYAFLRERPYATVEPPNSRQPDWDSVYRVAERFAPPADRGLLDPERRGLTERWQAWRAAAEVHRS